MGDLLTLFRVSISASEYGEMVLLLRGGGAELEKGRQVHSIGDKYKYKYIILVQLYKGKQSKSKSKIVFWQIRLRFI